MTDLFSRDFDDLRTGDTFTTRGRTIGEGDVSLFAGLTGDHHPLHTDATFAAAHPFGARVAHGMLVASCAAGLVPFDPDHVLALRRLRDVVFKKPVALGDTIRVEGVLCDLSAMGDEAGLVAVEMRVRNQDDALVCKMTVDVLWKRGGGRDETEVKATTGGRFVRAGEAPAGEEFVPIPL